jgi:hypothetical protein
VRRCGGKGWDQECSVGDSMERADGVGVRWWLLFGDTCG